MAFITQETKDQIYDEENIYFIKHIDITTGNEVLFSEGMYFYYKDDEQIYVEDDKIITLELNKSTANRIIKRISDVLKLRGVKDVDTISSSDKDVQRLLNIYKKKNRRVSEEKVAATIEAVKSEHRPYHSMAIYQVILWALMAESVFTVSAKGVESKFSVEIPEEYWDSKVKSSGSAFDDELDKLLSGFQPYKPIIDKTNPLEIMLAIATQIVNDYSSVLSEHLEEAVKRTQTVITSNNEGYDDVGMFRTALREALS